MQNVLPKFPRRQFEAACHSLNRTIWCAATVLLMAMVASVGATRASATESIVTNADLSLSSTVAGAHPDVDFDLSVAETDPDVNGNVNPKAQFRQIDLDLPAGMVGNPQVPRCDPARLKDRRGFCPEAAQVGLVWYETPPNWPGGDPTKVVYPVYNLERGPNDLARLGFAPEGLAVATVDFKLREDGDYGVTATARNVPTAFQLVRLKMQLWGVPADPSHDPMRVGDDDWSIDDFSARCLNPYDVVTTGRSCPTTQPRPLPFVTNPTRCSGPVPLPLRVRYWDDAYADDRTLGPFEFTNCDAVPFDSSLTIQPTSRSATQPTGVSVDLRVPRGDDDDVSKTPIGAVRTVTAVLPEGMAISPSAASGLAACTDTQAGIGTLDAPACPESAKVGSVTVDSPLLDAPLKGAVYIGTQESNDPMSGDMYRIILVAEGSGTHVKLRGSIKADPRTGQLTTTFVDNPELPFDRMQLTFFGGDRAALANPPACGTYTTKYSISSWSGKTVEGSDSFTIDQGCPTGGFAPTFQAGTTNPMAGAFSPFTMTVRRGDADQELAGLSVNLPSGLLAALGSVPLCGEEQAAAGTCDAGSRVGTTTISSGPGNKPYSLSGPVYLAGPYKGAPFSLSIAVDAKAGPFDLGKVVVRSPLQVDASKAQASAPADPLPTIVGGVPLKVRMINIALDRPGFIFNATNCTASAVTARLTGTGGAVADVSAPYNPNGCANLPLKPSLSVQFTGGKSEMGKFKHPGIVADLAQTPGQSGLRQVAVTLPKAVALDAKGANVPGRLCMPEQVAARNCPESSRIGTAEARTIALHESLKGPVYFMKGTRILNGKTIATTPKLYLKLEGEGVPLDLIGDSTTAGGLLTTTFASVPDAPITSMRLNIEPGARSVLVANTNVCNAKKVLSATFDGQNGKQVRTAVRIAAPDCRSARLATPTVGMDYLSVKVVGIDPGRLTLRSNGSATRKQTVRLDDTVTLRAKLNRKVRQSIARGARTTITLRVTYQPSAKGAKAITLKKTITVRRKATAR